MMDILVIYACLITLFIRINALRNAHLKCMVEHQIEHVRIVTQLVENVLDHIIINALIVKLQNYFYKISNVKLGANAIKEHMEIQLIIYVKLVC